jgi:hypothetical protein
MCFETKHTSKTPIKDSQDSSGEEIDKRLKDWTDPLKPIPPEVPKPIYKEYQGIDYIEITLPKPTEVDASVSFLEKVKLVFSTLIEYTDILIKLLPVIVLVMKIIRQVNKQTKGVNTMWKSFKVGVSNWRTTVIGVVGGLVMILNSVLDWSLDPVIIAGAVIAILGIFIKDAAVGSKPGG